MSVKEGCLCLECYQRRSDLLETYLKREQKQYKDTLQLPSQDTQGVDSNVFGSTSSSKSNQPTRKTQADDSNEPSGSTSYTKISQPPCSNSVSVIQSPKQYIFSTLYTFLYLHV